MRRFVFRTGMRLQVREARRGEEEEVWADENVTVRTLHIAPDTAGVEELEEDGEGKRMFLKKVVDDMFCSDWSMDTMIDSGDVGAVGEAEAQAGRNPQLSTKLPPKGKTRAPWPASTVKTLPETTPNTVALSYLVRLHEQRGKFLPALARKLGVKPGPDFSKLTSGKSVTTAEGKVVNPEDVMEPSREGTGIAVCDVPGAEYLEGFVADKAWEDAQWVGCFFWLVEGGVVDDPRFLHFVERFPKARHIVSSRDVCADQIYFKAAAKSAVLLNSLDPEIFPEPKLDSTPRRSIDTTRFTIAAPGMQWQIEPKWQLREDTVEPLFSRQEIVDSESYRALSMVAQEYRRLLPSIAPLDIPGSSFEIFPLGTGSSTPSRHRNVSATLVHTPPHGYMLLDCGEGTLGQLRRLFGASFTTVLKSINLLYISHLHADHHLGATTLLRAKHLLMEPGETFSIVAPAIFQTWLEEYSLAEPGMATILSRVSFTSCESLLAGSEGSAPTLPHVTITTSPAHHCLSSFTATFTIPLPPSPPFILSYSGDTRPTAAFAAMGQGSTVLVHEATFGDDMAAQARAKKHSTVGEALGVAAEMGAKVAVLSHFSQRYPKLLGGSEGKGGGITVTAFDCSRIRMGEAGRWTVLRRGLGVLYSEEEEA
ncbi:beta-lactamase-like protein [Tricharina praecox]|uniref:beta-lactamase-like protein n=1 Tax=Tricharina praecox TaxID=43433 RepID=UPI00221F776F|nr:beta-lactamase-like protein [Tricharina praecox]KAI5856283.1 beta-lactamase-like protein [Tricharina praecox]